jgi:drug/metabolite transporter (DMT)-like permease
MIGELCALSSAFSFSTVNIAIRRGMRKSRDNGTFLSTFVNMIVFLVLIGVLYVGRYLPALTWAGFLLFLAAGLLTTFVGRSLHYEAIRVIGPSRAISLRMGAPIVTVCLAFVFLSERFSVLQYVGATAIIVGVWVLSRETMGRGDLRVVDPPRSHTMTPPEQQEKAVPAKSGLWLGILCALGSAISFGTGHFVRKVAVLEVPSPFWGMAIGTTTAWVAMTVHSMARGDLRELCRENFNVHAPPWYFIYSGILNAAGQMFIYLAVFFSPVSTVQVLATSEVLSTLLISRLFLGTEEPLGGRVIFCSVVICLGVVLMVIG